MRRKRRLLLPQMTVTHSTTSIYYRLRATAVRPALHANLTCRAPVDVIRTFGPNALEYQQTLESKSTYLRSKHASSSLLLFYTVENTWPGKLMYCFTLPHKAWAAGDTVMALVKFASLAKGIWVPHMYVVMASHKGNLAEIWPDSATTITETVKYGGAHGVEMKKDVCTIRHAFPRPASASNTPQHDDLDLGAMQQAKTIEASDSDDEVVAKIELRIPPYICPTTHTINGPVSISHRVRWVVIIRNTDGHFSELRCSLPLHILSRHMYDESIAASAPTRRLLFGIDDLILPEVEQLELPSYSSHVQDRIPGNIDGWGALDIGPLTAVSTPGNSSNGGYFPSPSGDSSIPSTPARTPFGSLPEEPSILSGPIPSTSRGYSLGSLAAASLSSTAFALPGQTTFHQAAGASASSSRPPSRPGSRPPSPIAEVAGASSSSSRDSHSHSHSHSHAHSNSHSSSHSVSHRKPLFSLGGIKPLTPFASRPSSRAPSRPTTPPPLHLGQHPASGAQGLPGPNTPNFDRALQMALSAVPDYNTASRGFAGGGVPPLSSSAGLPSYAEASRSRSEGDLAARLCSASGANNSRANTSIPNTLMSTECSGHGCPTQEQSSGSSSPVTHHSPSSLSDLSDEHDS